MWFLTHFAFQEHLKSSVCASIFPPVQKLSQIIGVKAWTSSFKILQNQPWNQPHMAPFSQNTSQLSCAHGWERRLKNISVFCSYFSTSDILLFFHLNNLLFLFKFLVGLELPDSQFNVYYISWRMINMAAWHTSEVAFHLLCPLVWVS